MSVTFDASSTGPVTRVARWLTAHGSKARRRGITTKRAIFNHGQLPRQAQAKDACHLGQSRALMRRRTGPFKDVLGGSLRQYKQSPKGI